VYQGSLTLFKFVSDLLLHSSRTVRKKMEKKEVAPEMVEKGAIQEKSKVPMRCRVDCGVEVP
jgi:hypothetical protein